MGATIHFKVKYHGLKFTSDFLDYFYSISTTRSNVNLGKDCKTNLPPYIEFNSKDFPTLQQNIDEQKIVSLSDLKVLYFRDLGVNQQTWVTNQINVKISNKSFEDADNHTYSALTSETINASSGKWVILAPTGYNDISLQNNTDVYVILVIDSDPQSDSWYYPSVLYCSDDYYDANTKIFSDGKPDTCARWSHTSFKGIFYPTKNQLNIQTGMTDNSAKEVYINNFDTKQGKYISSTKYNTPFVLPSDYTDYPNIKHFLSFTKLYEGELSESKPATPYEPDKKTQIIIDFLHDDETTVHLVTWDGMLKWANIATNPINYNFTRDKGVQVWLQTDVKPDSTKYITKDDTIYNIYYFKNGKPSDLNIKNYSLDYLNKNADIKYVTNTKSNRVEVSTVGYVDEPYKYHVNEKNYEIFKTPCSFNDYGYYLILPVKLKDYYGVLIGENGSVIQKIYPNKENKIEEKYWPKDKNTVIGYYSEPYNKVGVDLNNYYFYHNKDYGITTKGFIDPNRYNNFICIPFNLMDDGGSLGDLPAFELRYTDLINIKTDLGGYYNPTTHKIDPIKIKENTGSSTGSSGSTGGSTTTGGTTGTVGSTTTGGTTGTVGSTGTSGSTTTGGTTGTGGSTGTSGLTTTGGTTGTGGSTSTTSPNTPINSNDQIHLYSINQQNIIDLSSKDLSYQTSLNGFATYNVNNFINQVYILPFSLPTNLKENVSNIVTGLFKLDTDTIAIKQDHYDLNLGSITIKPKYNNGFDYNVTKCVLHLPFTNLINLDINDILNKTISIKYKVSLLNADTTINILSDDNLIFTGKINIGTDLQLFSINSNDITGLLNSVLQNDVLVPYITITRNKPINNLVSYETNEHNQLNNYTGFVQTNNSSVSCGTQEEQQEIENLLNGGIYIK